MSLTSLVLVAALQATAPLATVKEADAEAQKVLQAPDPTTDKLAAKADQYVDFAELAKRALGASWSKISKKEQEDFSATMKGLLRANYAQKLLNENRGTATFVYGAEKVSGNEATVNATLQSKTDKFPIVYKLYRATQAAQWKIYDVVTDDVSLVATYNDQFRTVIAKKGFAGLMTSLKAKRAQLEKSGAASSAAKTN